MQVGGDRDLGAARMYDMMSELERGPLMATQTVDQTQRVRLAPFKEEFFIRYVLVLKH